MSNEILTVNVVKGRPGDRYVTCPHCKASVYLPYGPVRGEQFQHSSVAYPSSGCGGWFDVAHDAAMSRE